jgi:hypothetical protein
MCTRRFSTSYFEGSTIKTIRQRRGAEDRSSLSQLKPEEARRVGPDQARTGQSGRPRQKPNTTSPRLPQFEANGVADRQR